MSRRRMLSAFKAGAAVGNYADMAVLPIDVDPQLVLSRNWIKQPFYQIFAKDTVIVQMSGSSRICMRNSNVNYFIAQIGDNVYIPAGTPHRIEPIDVGVMLRYVALEAGLEAASWFCHACGEELHRLEWEHDNEAEAPPIYATACARFSANLAARTCTICGTVADPIDLDILGWSGLVSEPVIMG
ncbi:hypothetical protein [Nocardia colli]|uniref:hypothetical protein n=1 Tax=Nocardia colli TaxID=2545717 RepID=UPI0035DCDBE8